MTDFAKLKTLAGLLKPLGEMIPLIEKAESVEQALRTTMAKLDKTNAAVAKAEVHLAEVEELARLCKQETEDLDRNAKAAYTLTVERAAAEARDMSKEANEILSNAKSEADKIVADAFHKAKTIDSTIAEKSKECDRLTSRIDKLKGDLRKLLASAD